MKKYIIIGILIGFLSFPTIILGGTFVSSLIEGKTIEESMQILAKQIDEIFITINNIENKQSKLEKKIYCLELIKETPDWGSALYIHNNIIKFYESAKENLDKFQKDPSYNYPGQLEKWEKAVNEAEPLYVRYIQECE